MSESILDHGYIPEEHAPDPVIEPRRPDAAGQDRASGCSSPAKSCSSSAILGTYIVLRSGSPELFAEHAAILSKLLAGINTIVLILRR